jgi:hypothetical protein
MDRHHDLYRPVPDQQLAERLAIPGEVRPTVWRTPPGEQPGCLSPELARLLLDGHTQIGDVIVDIDDDIALATTAAAAGRRHHALDGDIHLADLGHAAGYIDLILLHWPRPVVNPRNLLLACRPLLHTAGCVAVAVRVDADQRAAHLSALTGIASTAGLRTIRHITAVAATPPDAADLAGGRVRPSVHTPPARSGAGVSDAVHPHTDLLIFEPGGHDD